MTVIGSQEMGEPTVNVQHTWVTESLNDGEGATACFLFKKGVKCRLTNAK